MENENPFWADLLSVSTRNPIRTRLKELLLLERGGHACDESVLRKTFIELCEAFKTNCENVVITSMEGLEPFLAHGQERIKWLPEVAFLPLVCLGLDTVDELMRGLYVCAEKVESEGNRSRVRHALEAHESDLRDALGRMLDSWQP